MLTLLNHAKLSSSAKCLHQRRVRLTCWGIVLMHGEPRLISLCSHGSEDNTLSSHQVILIQYILSNILTNTLFSNTKPSSITSKSFRIQNVHLFMLSMVLTLSHLLPHITFHNPYFQNPISFLFYVYVNTHKITKCNE